MILFCLFRSEQNQHSIPSLLDEYITYETRNGPGVGGLTRARFVFRYFFVDLNDEELAFFDHSDLPHRATATTLLPRISQLLRDNFTRFHIYRRNIKCVDVREHFFITRKRKPTLIYVREFFVNF